MTKAEGIPKQVKLMCTGCSRAEGGFVCKLFEKADQVVKANAGACDRAIRTSPDGQSMTHEGRVRAALGGWFWRRTLPTRLPTTRKMRSE